MVALVTATGANTYFGKTAKLVSSAKSVSHFQKAVLTIGDYLIYLSLGLAAILLLTMLFRGEPVLTLFQFALILVVAAIPVAMPAVLSVTMAIGAVVLARMKAILTRLESIEEMAGMDILCSDKTGTLTQNKLTLGEPALFGAKDAQELMLAGALASKAEDRDAIDLAVLNGLKDPAALKAFQPDQVRALRSRSQAHRGGGARLRRQLIQSDQRRAAGDSRHVPPGGGPCQSGGRQGERIRRQRLPHSGRGASDAPAARGNSWGCCRSSIRRARIPPNHSRGQ